MGTPKKRFGVKGKLFTQRGNRANKYTENTGRGFSQVKKRVTTSQKGRLQPTLWCLVGIGGNGANPRYLIYLGR